LVALRKELHALADPADATFLQGFFKTVPGQYGAGDKFLGLRVPDLRRLVREYPELEDSQALEMLASPWHEERLLALLFLVHMYRRGDDSVRKRIHRAYLANTRYINNWDLVDASAHYIVGQHLDARNVSLLERLARSNDIWERRIGGGISLAGGRVDSHNAYSVARLRLGPDKREVGSSTLPRPINLRSLPRKRQFPEAGRDPSPGQPTGSLASSSQRTGRTVRQTVL